MRKVTIYFLKVYILKKIIKQGRVQDFWKGGGPISLGSLKKGHQILKGGGPMVWRGGVQYICLTMTTKLAYLEAKEWTNMYFEP